MSHWSTSNSAFWLLFAAGVLAAALTFLVNCDLPITETGCMIALAISFLSGIGAVGVLIRILKTLR